MSDNKQETWGIRELFKHISSAVKSLSDDFKLFKDESKSEYNLLKNQLDHLEIDKLQSKYFKSKF